ncbi:MAG: hypothetical protein ACI8TX_002506, partial [Hyphomicrobiaceae bacterium]
MSWSIALFVIKILHINISSGQQFYKTIGVFGDWFCGVAELFRCPAQKLFDSFAGPSLLSSKPPLSN